MTRPLEVERLLAYRVPEIWASGGGCHVFRASVPARDLVVSIGEIEFDRFDPRTDIGLMEKVAA